MPEKAAVSPSFCFGLLIPVSSLSLSLCQKNWPRLEKSCLERGSSKKVRANNLGREKSEQLLLSAIWCPWKYSTVYQAWSLPGLSGIPPFQIFLPRKKRSHTPTTSKWSVLHSLVLQDPAHLSHQARSKLQYLLQPGPKGRRVSRFTELPVHTSLPTTQYLASTRLITGWTFVI